MTPKPDPAAEARYLQASGFLLPPVLSAEDVRRALDLQTADQVVSLYVHEGLPLASVGGRLYISRVRFQRWLDELAGVDLSGEGAR